MVSWFYDFANSWHITFKEIRFSSKTFDTKKLLISLVCANNSLVDFEVVIFGDMLFVLLGLWLSM